jgi:hypothetical protein
MCSVSVLRSLVAKLILHIARTLAFLPNSHPQLHLPLVEFSRDVTDHPWVLFTEVSVLIGVKWAFRSKMVVIWAESAVRWVNCAVGGRDRVVSGGRDRW